MKIDLNKPIKVDLTKLKQLRKDNPRAFWGGVILALALGVAVYFIIHAARNNSQPTVQGNPGAVDKPPSVLPEARRSDTAGQPTEGGEGQYRDPFAGPLVLKGVVRGGAKDMAIIEVGDSAFVAEKGALVADTWTVEEIKSTSVTLKSGNKKIQLEFGGRSKTEKVKPEGQQENTKSGSTAAENKDGGGVTESAANNAQR
ncbi:MAG: hypothetical protein ACOY46_14535 [Bacillota bacterium]